MKITKELLLLVLGALLVAGGTFTVMFVEPSISTAFSASAIAGGGYILGYVDGKKVKDDKNNIGGQIVVDQD